MGYLEILMCVDFVGLNWTMTVEIVCSFFSIMNILQLTAVDQVNCNQCRGLHGMHRVA
jgi:hypothetical protein